MKHHLIIFSTMLTVLGTGVLGYPPQERLMPDGAPVPEDAAVFEDSVASASEVLTDDYDDKDDSDMYMEPDGAETMDQSSVTNEPVRIETVTSSSSSVSQRSPSGEEIRVSSTVSEPQIRHDDDAVSAPTISEIPKNIETDSQNFFPSFAELFANHRLPYNEQQHQQRYRPNRFLGYFQRDRAAYQTAASTAKDTSQHPLLGSGNFGVIRGGTYYPADKTDDDYNVDESLYNPYYTANGPRGRANYYRNPKPQPIRNGDFFANFRDFADITAPPKSSFSHLSIVYANKNATRSRNNEPRNIIETLKMLEGQDDDGFDGPTTTSTERPTKKPSQGKRKLIIMKKYHDDKARKIRMTVEPLLALS